MEAKKKILLAPIDPVHDIGLKIINRGLVEAGYDTILLPPDLPTEEIIQTALKESVDTILLSRTLGYGVSELLAKFVDYADAVGIRDAYHRLGMASRLRRVRARRRARLAAATGHDVKPRRHDPQLSHRLRV